MRLAQPVQIEILLTVSRFSLPGIDAPKRSAAGQLDIFGVVALDERIVMTGSGGCPIHAGNRNIMPADNVVIVFPCSGGLPQHGAFFYAKVYVILELDVGNNVASAVVRVIAGNHYRSAAFGGYMVDCRLNGRSVVGKSVACGAEARVRCIDRVIRKLEGIGVFRKSR